MFMSGRIGIDMMTELPTNNKGDVNLQLLYQQLEAELPRRKPTADLGVIVVEPLELVGTTWQGERKGNCQ